MKVSTRIASSVFVVLLVAAKLWSVAFDSTPAGPEQATQSSAEERALDSGLESMIRPVVHVASDLDGMDLSADLQDDATNIEQRRQALIQSDPELLDRARQQVLARAAEARWAHAVDEGEYSARDLDPSIRTFFSEVELEPRYVGGGEISGLVITQLRDDHPLVAAGFRVGDRLSRIQGVALKFPEEIPSLLARLGPNFSICRAAAAGDAEECEEFALR